MSIRAVVQVALKDEDVNAIVNTLSEAGWTILPGDPAAMVKALLHYVAADTAKVEYLGQHEVT
jgi:hypothetical protein